MPVRSNKTSLWIISNSCHLGANTIFLRVCFWQGKKQIVRLAKLQIDSTQLENYKTALKEEITTSVHVEPGVLTFNAVFEKNNPAHITILEIYANEDVQKVQEHYK